MSNIFDDITTLQDDLQAANLKIALIEAENIVLKDLLLDISKEISKNEGRIKDGRVLTRIFLLTQD